MDIDHDTPKETYSGYLDFNEFLSKELTQLKHEDGYNRQYAGNIGTRGSGTDGTAFAPKPTDIQTFSSADQAMAACMKGNFSNLDIIRLSQQEEILW